MYQKLFALLLTALLLSGCAHPPAAPTVPTTEAPTAPATEAPGYQEGWEQGRAEGLAEGSKKAREEGYQEGHDAGYQEGLSAGHDQGYDEGYQAGLAETEAPQAPTLSPAEAAGFVSVGEYIPDVILEIRYYSTYNFAGERIDGYEAPVALLTLEAARALKAVSEDVRQQGYRLKIYDTYRPQQAVDHFAAWAADLDATAMKPYFYPEVDKEDLFDAGYIAYHSGHSRGSTVDLTLFDMETGKEADMGGTFDWFGVRSHSDFSDLTLEQQENRQLLYDAMVRHGFHGITSEWWHFTLDDEPYPDTYFDFPVA